MKNAFCMIISRDKIYQGVAACRSLMKYMDESGIFILAMDDETFDILQKMNMEKTRVIHKSSVEKKYPEVLGLKRAVNEYCWTFKPVFLDYVLIRFPDIQRVTYFDADLLFFHDPNVIFDNAPDCSVLLSTHDFDAQTAREENNAGKYNSGFISFKRDAAGYSCIYWWRVKCIEWCHNWPENGKFGDQRYLESFAGLFPGVCEIKTPGVNIAPWNHSKYQFNERNGNVYINNDRLIFYHFCGFRLLNKNEFGLMHCDRMYIPLIHGPYIAALGQVIDDIEKIEPNYHGYYIEKPIEKIIKKYSINSINK